MKHIKTYEKRDNEIFEKLPLILHKLSTIFFDDFYIRMKYNQTNVDITFNFTEDGYSDKKPNNNFLKITFTKKQFDIYYIGLESGYTPNHNIYKRCDEFKDYICDLIKPLSYNHDDGYYVHKNKMEKLLSLISVEDYNTYMDTNKYNI